MCARRCAWSNCETECSRPAGSIWVGYQNKDLSHDGPIAIVDRIYKDYSSESCPLADRNIAEFNWLDQQESIYYSPTKSEHSSTKITTPKSSNCLYAPSSTKAARGSIEHLKQSSVFHEPCLCPWKFNVCRNDPYNSTHLVEQTVSQCSSVSEFTSSAGFLSFSGYNDSMQNPIEQSVHHSMLPKPESHRSWDPDQSTEDHVSFCSGKVFPSHNLNVHFSRDEADAFQQPYLHHCPPSVVGYPLCNGERVIQDKTQLTSRFHDAINSLVSVEWQQRINSSAYPERPNSMYHPIDYPHTPTNNYFWQYNSQCKGPKAIKLIDIDNSVSRIKPGPDEPDSTADYPNGFESYACKEPWEIHSRATCTPFCNHVCCNTRCSRYSQLNFPEYPLVMFEDPVQRRYDLVHCSKLRRGDGNDVTPNLPRLRAMGEELDCLNQQLAEHGELIMAGTSGSSFMSSFTVDKLENLNVQCVTSSPDCMIIEQAKREKNKLASKICRLKKKAFHEANKIKYTGLGMEYDELIIVIDQIKRLIRDHLRQKTLVNPSNASRSECPINNHAAVEAFQTEAPDLCHNGLRNDCHLQINTPMLVSGGSTECGRPSLLSRAMHICETINVTRAAGRTDALVDEVLRLSRLGLMHHPLVRGMTFDLFNRFEKATEPRSSTYYANPDLEMKTERCCSMVITQSPEHVKQLELLQPPKFVIPYYQDLSEEQDKHM